MKNAEEAGRAGLGKKKRMAEEDGDGLVRRVSSSRRREEADVEQGGRVEGRKTSDANGRGTDKERRLVDKKSHHGQCARRATPRHAAPRHTVIH